MVQKKLSRLFIILGCLLALSEPVLADTKDDFTIKKEELFSKPVDYKDLENLKLTFEFAMIDCLTNENDEIVWKRARKLFDDLYSYWLVADTIAKKHVTKKRLKKKERNLVEERLMAVNKIGAYLISLDKALNNKLSKSVSMLKEAVTISEKFFPNSVLLADAYHNLASSYSYKKNEFDQALTYYNRALKLKKFHLGEQHMSTIRTHYNIGLTYHYFQSDEKAITYLKGVLIMLLDNPGEEKYRLTLKVYELLGKIYEKQDIYAIALEYYREALNFLADLPAPQKEAFNYYVTHIERMIKHAEEQLAKQ